MEQIKSDVESCSSTVGELIEVPGQVESDLKSWSASSMDEFKAVKIGRKCKLSTWPNWRCILCNKTISYGEVYQCQQGHLACYPCSRSGQSCEKCSKAVSRIRNLVVEEMIRSTVVTCKFATLGCTEVIEFRNIRHFEHEKQCSFAPMICPMPGCHHAGVENLFTKHVLTDHSDINSIVNLVRCGVSGMRESSEFELDSSTTLVLLREIGHSTYYPVLNEFHLLHQESTRSDDILHLTSLTKCSKRRYAIDVRFSQNLTYFSKGNFDMEQEEEPILLIPNELGSHPLKKKCSIIRTYLS